MNIEHYKRTPRWTTDTALAELKKKQSGPHAVKH